MIKKFNHDNHCLHRYENVKIMRMKAGKSLDLSKHFVTDDKADSEMFPVEIFIHGEIEGAVR